MKKILKALVPIIFFIYYRKYFKKNADEIKSGQLPADIFNRIYHKNLWGSAESVSGPGSENKFASTLIPLINRVIYQFNIKSVLDIPCGDFNWIKGIDFNKLVYTGADIVPEIVNSNLNNYQNNNITFLVLDLTRDDLPKSDLIICRDCLVHLSYENILKALERIKLSGSKYLLATSFNKFPANYDIPTGNWRQLNLQKSPFNLPKPILEIEEAKYKNMPDYDNKVLALWDIDSL